MHNKALNKLLQHHTEIAIWQEYFLAKIQLNN
jgi:hypothetical protein